MKPYANLRTLCQRAPADAPELQASARRSISFHTFLMVAALLLWLALRLVLLLDVGPAQLNTAESLRTFGLGAWFDFNTLAYLLAPWLLASALLPNRLRTSGFGRFMRWGAAWIVIASLLFGVVAEFVFWQEFTTRFNFIAVDYLIYTHEVIGNIEESYPVAWIFAAIGAMATLCIAVARHYLKFRVTPYRWGQRVALAALALLLPLASYQVANIDQAQADTNNYATELSGNGLFTLAAAMRRNELNYQRFYRTIPQDAADKTLAALGVMRLPLSEALNPAQKVAFRPQDVHEPAELGPFTRRPKNVVLISVESLSADYMGVYGNKEKLTPRLDQIARDGLMFDRLFATGTRTVRGLDALSLGTPPIPGQAIVHRPHNEHLATIGEFLEAQGYSTMFIYGGYGYFDNMNAYFRGNDYRVIDRTDFDDKTIAAENIWGVADESLFDNTLNVLDQSASSGKPFFAQIMTTSNHRPYTFPSGRIDLPSGHRSGAVKYTDYAIGRFIDQARAKPWFKDTLFVIVADHCASVAGKTSLPVDKYHIPLIFYAPDMLKPGVHYARVASQIDVPPTLLDLLGARGDDHFFGQSLFEAAAEHEPARAFISNYQELGYYKNDTLIVLSPKQRIQAFAIDPVTFEAREKPVDPALAREAIAYYQTAAVAYKHGKLKEHADDIEAAL